jgi:biotin operon repressor
MLCRSFAKLKSEFPLSQASLADRLSITRQGAGCVIESLKKVGVSERTTEAKPHSRAACYQWVA